MSDALGHRWRSLFAVFALSVCAYGQFNSSDRQQLSDIRSDTFNIKSAIQGIEQSLGSDVSGDLDNIYSALSSINTKAGNTNIKLDNIKDKVDDISTKMASILSSVNAISADTDDCADSLSDISTVFDAYSSSNLTAQASIVNKLDSILRAVQSSGGGSDTNLMLLLSTFFAGNYSYIIDLTGNRGQSEQWDEMSDYVSYGSFYDLWQLYGNWRTMPTYFYSLVPYSYLNQGLGQDFKKGYRAIFGDDYGTTVQQRLEYLAKPYYYLYGTKDITTNTAEMVSQLDCLVSSISNHNTTGISSIDSALENNTLVTDSGFDSGSTSLVSRIGNSLFSYSTELPTTNDVVAIDNSTLSGHEASVKSDSLNSSVTSCIGTFNSSVRGAVDSVFSGSDDSGAVVIEGIGAGIISGYDGYDLSLPGLSAAHMNYVHWFIGGLRVLAVLIFARQIMNKVANSYLESPDPF